MGERLQKDDEEEVIKALKSEIHYVTIAGTPMPGLFLAGYGERLIVPTMLFPKELKVLENLGFEVVPFETRLTCLGNNLVCNENGCIANPEFTDSEIERLKKVLQVPVTRIEIAGIQTPGACILLNGKRAVIHRDASEEEIEVVRSVLDLESVEPASVNLGSPYLHAGILNNDHGMVISSQSGGPEIVYIEQSLNYEVE